MKVLLCHRPGGAFGYISDGWVNALRDKGHEVCRWDGVEATWREFQPELQIGCSGHKQPILADRSDCKVAIHVNSYGPINTGVNENEADIRWTLAQKPDAVFGYGHEEDRHIWSNWTNIHGVPWVPMPCAGDKVIFHDDVPPENRQFDIVYLGGRWEYKAKTIDAYLLPVVRDATLKCSVRGWGDWPNGVCGGGLPAGEANEFLNSGRVGPCVAEIHTHQYGIDIPERAFKVALCGMLVIHDAVPTIKRFIPSVVVAKDEQDFANLCGYYSKNEGERIKLVRKQQAEVLANHTYHHRISTLLSALGFEEEAKGMLE